QQGQALHKIGAIGDRPAVDAEDDIADPHAHLVARTAGRLAEDERAVGIGQAQRSSQRRLYGLRVDTQPRLVGVCRQTAKLGAHLDETAARRRFRRLCARGNAPSLLLLAALLLLAPLLRVAFGLAARILLGHALLLALAFGLEFGLAHGSLRLLPGLTLLLDGLLTPSGVLV